MNIDQKKLDELFSEEESAAAEIKAKSKVGARAKVKPEKQEKKPLFGSKEKKKNNSFSDDVTAPADEEIPVPEAAEETETLSALDSVEAEPDPVAPVEDLSEDTALDEAPLDEAADEEAVVEADTADPSDADAAIPDEDKDTITLHPSKVVNTIFDWLGSLFIALVCVLLVMSFGFRVIDVDGKSMETTLIDTDKVIITDLFYTPHNGDIIVISHGKNYEKPLIKRVIAIPGQELRIDFDNNAVYVDGEKLDEPYIQGLTIRSDKLDEEVNCVIPEGKLFVMGDNRTNSLDSRSKEIDLIDLDWVIGKAQIVVIPHSYDDGNLKLDLSRIRYLY